MNWSLTGSLEIDGAKGQAVNFVKYDSCGEYCVSGGSDRLVRLWNLASRSLIASLEGHSWEVSDASVSADRLRIASVGGDKAVFVWDVSTGRLCNKMYAHSQRINCVAFSPNSSVLASGSNDRSVCLWDMRAVSRKPLQTLTDALDSITTVAIGSCQIISGSVDGAVRSYDLRNLKLTTDELNVPVGCITLNLDESALLCSLMNSTLVLLDRTDGKMLLKYRGHTNSEFKMFSTFTYDDCHVASGSENGDLLVWDLVSEEPEHIVKHAHSEAVLGIDSNPTKMELASASADGTIKIWAA